MIGANVMSMESGGLESGLIQQGSEVSICMICCQPGNPVQFLEADLSSKMRLGSNLPYTRDGCLMLRVMISLYCFRWRTLVSSSCVDLSTAESSLLHRLHRGGGGGGQRRWKIEKVEDREGGGQRRWKIEKVEDREGGGQRRWKIEKVKDREGGIYRRWKIWKVEDREGERYRRWNIGKVADREGGIQRRWKMEKVTDREG